MLDSDLDEAITETPTKSEDSTKTIEKLYDSDGDFIYVKPSTKTETKDFIKTRTKGTSTLVPNPTTISTPELSLKVKNVKSRIKIVYIMLNLSLWGLHPYVVCESLSQYLVLLALTDLYVFFSNSFSTEKRRLLAFRFPNDFFR